MSILSAAKTNDEATALIALRDKLSALMDNCDTPKDAAQLARQLQDVLKRLTELVPDEDPDNPLAQARSIVADKHEKS